MKHDLPRRLGAAGPRSAVVVSSSTLYSGGCISELPALIAEEKKSPILKIISFLKNHLGPSNNYFSKLEHLFSQNGQF